jgi:hypothetical protein
MAMKLSRSLGVPGALLLLVLTLVAGCSTAASVAPSTQPSEPSPAAEPSSNASPTAPPALTETFTSAQHGISLSYPAGWMTKAATEPWTTSDWGFDQPTVDIVYDPKLDDGHLFLSIGSQPLGTSTADKWIAERMAFVECTATEPITVDGASGSACADGGRVFVTTGDRGYMITLYTSGDEGWLDSVYDRAFFDDVLSTVKLDPTKAS